MKKVKMNSNNLKKKWRNSLKEKRQNSITKVLWN